MELDICAALTFTFPLLYLTLFLSNLSVFSPSLVALFLVSFFLFLSLELALLLAITSFFQFFITCIGRAFFITLGSFSRISKLIIDVSSSGEVGGFGFVEFDDGGGEFDELSENRLASIARQSKENMPFFWKPVFISATVIDSYRCLHNFVKFVLQQVIGAFYLRVTSFRFWVILLKRYFNGWHMTRSNDGKTRVMCGRQYMWIFFLLHKSIESFGRWEPWLLSTRSLWRWMSCVFV